MYHSVLLKFILVSPKGRIQPMGTSYKKRVIILDKDWVNIE